MGREYQVTWCDVWQLLQDFSDTYGAELSLQLSVKPGMRKDAVLEIICMDRMTASGLTECGRWRFGLPRKEAVQLAPLVLYRVNQAIEAMRSDPWSMPTLLRREIVPKTE